MTTSTLKLGEQVNLANWMHIYTYIMTNPKKHIMWIRMSNIYFG